MKEKARERERGDIIVGEEEIEGSNLKKKKKKWERNERFI